MATYPSIKPYESSSKLARLAVICFAATSIVYVLAACNFLFQILAISRYMSGNPISPMATSLANAFSSLVDSLQGPLGMAAPVIFLIWFYRVYRNLPALGARGLSYSPGWVVWSFFIPIVGQIVPYMAATEVWKASDPEAGADSWHRGRQSTLIVGWWALFLLPFAVVCAMMVHFWNSIASVYPAYKSGYFTEADVLPITSELLIWLALFQGIGAVGAYLALMVIRKITARQEEKFKRVTVASVLPESYAQAAPAMSRAPEPRLTTRQYLETHSLRTASFSRPPTPEPAPSPAPPSQSNFCPYCGKRTPRDSEFCVACGRAIVLPATLVPAEPFVPEPLPIIQLPELAEGGTPSEATSPAPGADPQNSGEEAPRGNSAGDGPPVTGQ